MAVMKEKYSYSKISTYDDCPFRFKLKYLDKNFFFSGNLATEFGSLIHGIEEDIANTIKEGKPIDYVALKNKFILKNVELQHKYPVEYVTDDKSERNYLEKSRYYLETGIYRLENFLKENPDLEVVAAEQKFEFDFTDKVYFNGSIDRVFKNKKTGKYIIQDIKSYSVPIEDDKLITPLQFVTYVLAAKQLYKINAEDVVCEYDLPLCNLTQKAGTAGFMTRGSDKLRKLLTKIDNGEYAPKPSPLCHWCEFCQTNPDAPEEGKMMCPYYSHWTRDHKDFSVENKWDGLEKHKAILEAYHEKYGKKE